VPHPEFKVLMTSRFAPEDYAEFLQSMIPLEKFLPIYILDQ
jgi:hypothetical protein